VICVLVVGSGATWESPVLTALGSRADLTVLKRCVDVNDLLATATLGQADVAVVGVDAPGLDAAAVEHLRRHRVRAVGVVEPATGTSPEVVRARAARIGVRSLVRADDTDGLLAAVAAAPEPTAVRSSASGGGGRPPSEVSTTTAPAVAPSGRPRSPDGLDGPDGAAPPDDQGSSGGRAVAVWGPAGAPGRTTVAVTLAATLARRGEATLLVDADPWGGTVAQQLGVLDEVSGLLTVARNSAAGDLEQTWLGATRTLEPHLHLVSGLPRADRWAEVRPDAVEHLVELARVAGHVVVDTGFSLEEDELADLGGRPTRNQLTTSTLAVVDEVVVVGNADPVGLARLARGLGDLREVVGPTPVRVVVNRMRPTLGWSERDVLAMVHDFARPASVHFLPDDRATTDKALVTGRHVLDGGDSPLVRAVAELADAVVPTGAPSTGRSRRARRRR